MRRTLAVFAVLLIVILCAVVFLPQHKENKAFESAVEAERQGAGTRKTAISLYNAYLRRWPTGKHARAGKSRVRDLQFEQIRDDFAQGLSETVRTQDYGKAVTAISLGIAEKPKDQMARLRRAFLIWGFDRFDRDSWQRSLEDIDVVLEQNGVAYVDSHSLGQKPIVRLAVVLMDHATSYQPLEPPATSPEFRGVRSIKASNIIEFYVGAAAILPGQTATFGDDGKLTLLQDRSGTYRLKQIGKTRFMENEDGIRFVYTTDEDGKQKLVPAADITKSRLKLLSGE